ncbi:hypothetical protein Tsubulata_011035 [Turnera subulata]|uniref:Pollen Ole e 1 allergen and extensin family protein n=1 Tax=Turnera subulata TaxID=218843 RepID=A0A9Q0F422_9ROSI|nr:hypothetical protein Tsubulata_011035 [Turnera subulata]
MPLQKLLSASPMFASSMVPIAFLVLLATFLAYPLSVTARPPANAANPTSRITVVGVVFCDTCSTNSFSKHSYFLPGVDVHIQCMFKANSPKTAEQITFSVNRTTDRYGIYKLQVPEVDGVDCVDGLAIESVCQARLIGSSSPACNSPGLKTSTSEITVKSKQDNLCIYSLSALSYRPSKRNSTLCKNQKEVLLSSFNSSKFFLPYFPPYTFPWPPLPNLPPLPHLPFPPLPPLTSLPFPFPPSLPFPNLPYPRPPSLPFPFPPLPPFPPSPSLFHPPPPPAFNLGDPRTWIPNIPLLSPPPPPAFNLGDPRTWIPNIPLLSPPPPPPPPTGFNLRHPRTWIPYIPPSPPNSQQNKNP